MGDKSKIIIMVTGWVILFVIGVYTAIGFFNSIQRIKPDELISTLENENGRYEARAYLQNGNATVATSVLVQILDKKTDRKKNIYLEYRCDVVEMKWMDENVIEINGTALDVRKDTYRKV